MLVILSSFKACVCYFLLNYYFFTKWWPFKNYEKCFLFHLKSSFHSWDLQIFVLWSFPLFLHVGHCFRGWLKINLKVYDAIDFKIEQVYLRSLIWIPLAGLKEKRNLRRVLAQSRKSYFKEIWFCGFGF